MDAQPVGPTGSAQVPPSINPVTPAVNAAPPATETALPGVPDSWPGAFGAYKYSKQAVKLNLGAIVSIWLLNIVVSSIAEFAFKRIGQVIALAIGSLAIAALTLLYVAGVRGRRLSISEALSEALPLWLKMIGLYIVIFISLGISLLLLIIPFFFVLPRLTLAYYFLVDQKMGILEAYKASWAATKGNVGKVWGIIFAAVAMALLMITIIGIPFSIYFLIMYSAAAAVLYEFLTKKNPAAAAAVTATPNSTAAAAPNMPPVVPPVPAEASTPVAPTSFAPTAPAPDDKPSDTSPKPPVPTVQ